MCVYVHMSDSASTESQRSQSVIVLDLTQIPHSLNSREILFSFWFLYFYIVTDYYHINNINSYKKIEDLSILGLVNDIDDSFMSKLLEYHLCVKKDW